MKTTLLSLILLLAPFAGFAQGKVAFGNDSLHLFVLNDAANLFPADAALANQPVPAGPLPSGILLVVGLYAGASSTSMTLQSSTTLLTGTGLTQPGRMATRNTILSTPGWVAGNPVTFQIAIWDSAVAAPGLSQTYVGYSPLFQATPGTSVVYPSIMPGGSSGSTLPASYNIVFPYLPEPSALTLLALGGAAVWLKRRK